MEKDITNCVLRGIRQIWKDGCVLPVFLFLVVSCVQRQDPDSLSEKEFAQAVENLVSVATSVESFFQESQSVEDMVARIDEIKAIEGVVDAYDSDNCVFIDIEGWGVIGYPFFDTPFPENGDQQSTDAMIQQALATYTTRAEDGNNTSPYSFKGEYSACIMNATAKEYPYTCDVAEATKKLFEEAAISVVVNDSPTLNFYSTEIYDYNLLLVICHGVYDENTNLHWVQTSQTFEIINNYFDRENTNANPPSVNYPEDEVMLIRSEEKWEGDRGIAFEYYVSEKYIQNSSTKTFGKDGEAVLFMVPCQSLKGKSQEHQGRKINDSLANVFLKEKKAGLYIGFDEKINYVAPFGGMIFYAKLLSGESFNDALNEFPSDDYTYQERNGYNSVAMHVLPSDGFSMDSHIVAPTIIPNENPTEFGYLFSAFAYYSPDIDFFFDAEYFWQRPETWSFSFVDNRLTDYGFYLCKGSTQTDGTFHKASVKRNPDSHRIDFTLFLPTITMEPNTEYHIWPYISHKNDYNYGDKFVFTTGSQGPSVPVPEAVDMGLSVKWASFNVGASKQEDCGSYFAWGETDPEKTSFSWTTYKWSGGVYQDEMTKYCTLASEGLNGFKDSKVTLEPDDDAARKVYGSNWRMPTKAEFEELIDPGKCIVKWDSLNGVPGLKVTSKKTGKFIFLPAAGGKSGDSMSGLNTFGRYWSSSLNEEGPYSAHYLYFKADNCYLYNYYRYYGYPVRAVYVE